MFMITALHGHVENPGKITEEQLRVGQEISVISVNHWCVYVKPFTAPEKERGGGAVVDSGADAQGSMGCLNKKHLDFNQLLPCHLSQ